MDCVTAGSCGGYKSPGSSRSTADNLAATPQRDMPGIQPGNVDYLVYTPPTPLYQQCVSLRARLLLVRGFGSYFALAANGSIDSSQFKEPVTQLWDVFSLGISLCYIFDLLPAEGGFSKINHSIYNPLVYDIDPDREKKSATALFAMEIGSPKFLRAIPKCQLFTADEIWDRGSTEGLIKAVGTVNAIIDHLPTSAFHAPPCPQINTSNILSEKPSADGILSDCSGRDALDQSTGGAHDHQPDFNEHLTLDDLYARVVDWKGLHLEDFGTFLSSNFLTTTRSNQDRTYHAFLFEKIVLFCQDVRVPHGRLVNSRTRTAPMVPRKQTLRLKGRIYLANVTTVLPLQPRSLAALGTTTRYPLTIWWNGNSSYEHITLKFHDQEQRHTWESQINSLSTESRLRDAIIKTTMPALSGLSEWRHSSGLILPRASTKARATDGCCLASRTTSWPQLTSRRPAASESYLVARSLMSDIIKDSNQRSLLAALQGGEAQCIVDFLNVVLHEHGALETDTGKYMLKLLSKLARSACVFPRCYELKDVEVELTKPQDGGGFADIYKGKCGKEPICLKVVRVFRRQDNSKLLSAHVKELTLWAHLEHENILPFYGAYHLNDSPERICIVSPWMQNGDLSNYLEKFSGKPRIPLVYDIVSGLSYLHQSKIIHGDLKAKNVLVSDSGRALLADFGLSHVALSTGLITTRISQGTMRWTAPELLADESEDYIPPTENSDVWSLGCLLYEIFTRKLPFHQYSNEFRILTAIVKSREIPLRPMSDNDSLDLINDHIWALMQRCWNYDPWDRPSCPDIKAFFAEFEGLHERLPIEHARTAGSDGTSFWKAVKAKSDPQVDYTQTVQILLRLRRIGSTNSSLTGDKLISEAQPDSRV